MYTTWHNLFVRLYLAIFHPFQQAVSHLLSDDRPRMTQSCVQISRAVLPL